MKVLIIFGEVLHFGMAASKRIICYAKGLESNGVGVKILMPFAFVVDPNDKFSQRGRFNGVEYEYLGYIDNHPKRKYIFPISYIVYFTKKALGYLSFFRFFIFRRKDYDVIYLYEDRTFFILLILLFNRQKVSILELCEMPYFYFDGLKKKVFRKIIETLIFPMFNGFVVISSNLEEYINIHKTEKAGVIKVPILTGNEYNQYFEQIQTDLPNESVQPYLIHTGSISEKKEGILGLVEAFGISLKDLSFPVKLIIVGDVEGSPVKSELIELIKKYDLVESVIFKGIVRGYELIKLQANSSLMVINRASTEQNIYGFPTKLGEFMTLGIPVIVTDVGEVRTFLKDQINAYVIPPGDINLLAMTIVKALINKEESKAIGYNGRLYAKNEFNPEYHGARMLKFFEKLKY